MLPVINFRDTLLEVVKIVIAFTVAQSITLSLATVGAIAFNARVGSNPV